MLDNQSTRRYTVKDITDTTVVLVEENWIQGSTTTLPLDAVPGAQTLTPGETLDVALRYGQAIYGINPSDAYSENRQDVLVVSRTQTKITTIRRYKV